MGLARLDAADGQRDELTGSGQIMGTVDYMAPEQAVSSKHADARADIYSLGVTLWYLLSGQPMYAGETAVEKLMAHQTKPIPSRCSVCSEVSPSLDAVFHRMVAKTPEDRSQTMAEVIADLEPFCGRVATAEASGRIAGVEDSKRDAFSQNLGPAHASHRRGTAVSKPAPAAAPATQAAPAPVADPDATQDWSGPQVDTDPKTEPSLPSSGPAEGGTTSARSAAFRRSKPARAGTTNWHDWRKLAAAGAGGLLLIMLGIWVAVSDKDGREVGRIKVPEGGSVTQEESSESATGKTGPADKETGNALPHSKSPVPLPPWNLPAGSPPPAIAPFDAAKAKEHQAAWAKHLGVPVEFENSIGMRFVLIPPGEFQMGSTEAEVARLLEEAKTRKAEQWHIDQLPTEAPQQRVRLTKPFYLGVCEVTQTEYERVMGSNPSKFKDDPTRPVEMVSWDEVSAFCRKLGKLAQKEAMYDEFRLPTEAEWEYACRAGTATTWYATDDEAALKEHAWFNANAGETAHPVGQKTPNAWGLYDMHGNVVEWCQDWRGGGYYATSPIEDPTGAGGGTSRVHRGGSWINDASYCRASFRYGNDSSLRYDHLGFRVARHVPSASP